MPARPLTTTTRANTARRKNPDSSDTGHPACGSKGKYADLERLRYGQVKIDHPDRHIQPGRRSRRAGSPARWGIRNFARDSASLLVIAGDLASLLVITRNFASLLVITRNFASFLVITRDLAALLVVAWDYASFQFIAPGGDFTPDT